MRVPRVTRCTSMLSLSSSVAKELLCQKYTSPARGQTIGSAFSLSQTSNGRQGFRPKLLRIVGRVRTDCRKKSNLCLDRLGVTLSYCWLYQNTKCLFPGLPEAKVRMTCSHSCVLEVGPSRL